MSSTVYSDLHCSALLRVVVREGRVELASPELP